MEMTMRNRQREYYNREIDRHFPGLRQKYQRTYGDKYGGDVPDANRLFMLCSGLCERHDIKTKLPHYKPQAMEQLSLFS